MTSIIQTLEELHGYGVSWRDNVVTVRATPEGDLANDTWRRMTELFLSRKHQVHGDRGALTASIPAR